jgi:hypothetical protein
MAYSGTYMCSVKHCLNSACVLALLVFAPNAARAQSISAVTILPSQPTPANPVSIQVSGTFPLSCFTTPTIQSSVSGSNVTVYVDTTYPTGGVCSTTVVPFSVSTSLGSLPAGAYTAVITVRANGAVAATQTALFSVAAGVPTVSLSALVLLALALVLMGSRLACDEFPSRTGRLS